MLTFISHAWRSWKRDRGVAFIAMLALAIGIGCATAIFTVVDAVLLRPLPYPESGRWVALLGGHSNDPNRYFGLSFAELDTYKQQTRSFEELGWFPVGGDYNLTAPGEPRHIDGLEVTPSLLASIGVRPVADRLFGSTDGPNVALISYRLFRQLGAGVIGRSIQMNGRSYQVLGAMPSWFRLPLFTVENRNSDNDVWVPLERPRDAQTYRNFSFYTGYAKLKPGVSLAQALADARRVAVDVRKEFHPADPTYTAALLSLEETAARPIRPILLVLLGASALLLLITCANVAGLLVARFAGCAQETAVRIALGGGIKQLAWQHLFESLMVSLASMGAALVASIALVRVVVSLAAGIIPRSDEISTNWPVIAFALGLAFVTAMLAALAPLWQALRTEPNDVLSDGVRASAGVRSGRLSRALVVAEVALAFTLISCGALLVLQLNRLKNTSPGFDPNGVLSFEISRTEHADDGTALAAADDKTIAALEVIPGVSSAAVTNQLPLKGCCFSTTLFPDGRTNAAEFSKPVSFMVVSSGYFKTMRIRLLAGRFLSPTDTNEKIAPVVIDDAAARRYWPAQSAIGQFAHVSGPQGSLVQVVGVAGTVQNEGLGETPTPELYLLDKLAPPTVASFVVRSSLPESTLAPAIRRALARVDPTQPVYSMHSMNHIRDLSLTFQRLESIIVSVFAVAALLLACLGVYGVTSYSVRQRTTELGTRMALGATGRDLLGMVVGSSARLSAYGVVLGAIAVIAATVPVMRALHVREIGAAPYVFSMCAVICSAALASLVPGWRASLLTPWWRSGTKQIRCGLPQRAV